jgi:hypothetical protein
MTQAIVGGGGGLVGSPGGLVGASAGRILTPAPVAIPLVVPAPTLALPPFPITSPPSGGWTQIPESRLVYDEASNKTFLGYIDGVTGNVEVRERDMATGITSAATILRAAISSPPDTHNAPALLVLADGRIMAAYSPHNGGQIYLRISTISGSIASFGTEQALHGTIGGNLYTYPILVQRTTEAGSPVYLFFRDYVFGTTSYLSFTKATDFDGAFWSPIEHVYANPGHYTYWKVALAPDGATLHFVVTDDNPQGGPCSIFHFSSPSAGVYLKSDGTTISASLPLAPSDLTRAYYTGVAGPAWATDLIVDGSGHPRFVFAVDLGVDASYRYARESGGTWTLSTIVGSIGVNTSDPGSVATVDAGDLTRAYGSQMVGGHREIFRYTTADDGDTWAAGAITSGSTVENVYPVAVRGPRPDTLVVAWLRGTLTFPAFDQNNSLGIWGASASAPAAAAASGLAPDPVVIVLAIPVVTLDFGPLILHQLFTIGSIGSELSQPFTLEGPPVSATLHQLFNLAGPVGSSLSQPFSLVADLVGSSLHQLFDLLAAGVPGGAPRTVPPLWQPLMVFDKAGVYLGSIAEFNVTGPPVRYLRSRRVTNEGGMTFNVSRHSPDIGLIASDRLVRLQSLAGETPWWGTMGPTVDADKSPEETGIREVECADPFTVLRDGPAITLTEEVSDGTPATAVYARLMALHNDLRAVTGDLRWELDLAGSKPFRGDLDLDTDTVSCLDLVIARSRTEIACDSRLDGNRLVPILRVRDRFDAGAGAAIYDGPGGNVLTGVKVVEDPTPLRFSIRLRGMTTDLAACLPEWAQWALLDIVPEITVSVDPGTYRNRQRLDESLDWGLSKAAIAAQCNAIVDWIWSLYRSFLRAVHDIEGRPWHDGWAYLGPPDFYEPKLAGRDSLSRRAFRTRLQLVELHTNEPGSAVMISDKHSQLDLREWLVVTYNRITGVQTVQTVAIPSAAGLSLVQWHNYGVVELFTVSGGRVTSRRSIAAGDGAYVDPYSVPVWDPILHRRLNLRRIISGPLALSTWVNSGDSDNRFTDLGPDAAIDQVDANGATFIGKMYDFEEDRIDDYDPRRDGVGILKAAITIFNGAETSRPRWHIASFDVGSDWSTSLTTGISATDTDFEVDSIMGAPDPDSEPGAFPFLVAIDDGSNREIVSVLSMVGALLHVVRGQGGTEAIIHEAGAPVTRFGAEAWAGFPFPYTWPEGAEWAADELAEISRPYIRVGAHVSHFRGDQLTIGFGTSHAVDVATEGPPGRWTGTERAIGWSTDAAAGETEIVGEWIDA